MFFKKRKNLAAKDIAPDEIFMDSANLPGFEREIFEGRLESPLPSKIPYVLLGIFILGLAAITFRLVDLSVINGKEYLLRAENNRLLRVRLAAERGLIYDRNKKELAWNSSDGRAYAEAPGFAHLLGYVGYAEEFAAGESPEAKIGKAGAEKVFNKTLQGKDGSRLIEEDSEGRIFSESVELEPRNGQNLILTIDAEIQKEVFRVLNGVVSDRGFGAGSGVILNARTGEILALASTPEFDSNTLSKGASPAKVSAYLNDGSKPFFFRAVEGLYPPGSTFKTVIALAALAEKTIDPARQILSTGSVSIPNPYFPDKSSVFYDWKAHGLVDMRRALAVSSNVYFYTVGGGFGDQAGLGVRKIVDYASRLGLGRKTGIEFHEAEGFLPTPEWKEKNDLEDPVWRIGDTYNLSIGQGMIQATPLQMAVLSATIAREGIKPQPRVLKSTVSLEGEEIQNETEALKVVDLPQAVFKVVKEGMRQAVLGGTASVLAGAGVPVAGKTGTAEIGSGQRVNSWFIGFLPYDDPEIALAIVLEAGSAKNLVGAPYAASQIVSWMVQNKPELINR